MDVTPYKKLKTIEEFNRLSNFIIIEDALTHENILYNKAFTDEIKRFEGRMPSFDERFISVDSYLDTIDGRLSVIEVSEKIFPETAISYDAELRKTVSRIEGLLRQEMYDDFLSSEGGKRNHDRLIDNVVKLTNDYYECPIAQVLTFDKNSTKTGTLLQYHRGTAEHPIPRKVRVADYWDNSFDNFFSRGYCLLCENMLGFAAFDKDLYDAFIKEHIERILIIPFFIEGHIGGFLVLSNPKMINGSFDFFLADFAGNAIGTLIYRGSLYANVYSDSLTGLPWNSSIDTTFERFMNTHKGQPVAMMMLDISRFRMITRSYGVKAADEILVGVANILKRKYPNSILSRKFGSDEFYVITNGLAENLKIEAHHIQNEIRAMFPEMLINMSFGIYQIKNPIEPLSSASLKVIFAHSQAKENPFLSVVTFDDQMAEAERRAQFFTDRFSKAMENNEFVVHIQPRYNLESNTFYGGEALIRWQIDGKLVPPGDFIPLFEGNGLCRDLDLFVLRRVCEFQAKLLSRGDKNIVPISVNYSRNDFSEPMIFEQTISILRDYGVPANLIEIEITESAYVDFEQHIMSFIEKCHVAGIHVLMDDFGSGISSFNSLKNLDVDALKLDCKFLSRSGSSKKRTKIIESIIVLSRSLDIPLIVEGLEEESDAAYFRSQGVRYVQGYLFGKPMPISEFERMSNKKAEFSFDYESLDSKGIFKEIVDSKSNLRLMLEQFPIAGGLYHFDGKSLMPIFINKKAIETVSEIGTVETFLKADLLSLLDEKSHIGALACLGKGKELYLFSDPRRVNFTHGVKRYPAFVSSMLVKKEGDGGYFVVLASMRGANETNEASQFSTATYTKEQYDKLFASSTRTGYILADLEGKVVSFNETAKKQYPTIENGKDISDLFGNDIPQHYGKRRFYNVGDDTVRAIEIDPIIIDGTNCVSISSNLMADGRLHLVKTIDDEFEFFDRALMTIDDIADYYTEVNLDDDRSLQMRLSAQTGDEKLFRQGKYSTVYYPQFMSMISDTDYQTVAEKMNFDALKDAARTNQSFELNFKIKGIQRYYRVRVRTFADKGCHYATFYSQDITEWKMKEYDFLTGLLNRNAGMSLMNRYIAANPLDKMAFIIMDLDSFKALNDTYGHPLGDKVLGEVKNAFDKLPEKYGIGTRLGGDEFCLLLRKREKDFSPEEVRKTIAEAMSECGMRTGLDHPVECTIGLAMIPEDGTTVEAVYGIADEDLYRSKKIKKAAKAEANE